VPFFNRRVLADLLGLPESAVDMIEGDAGGSFGIRGEFFPEDFWAAFAARALARPVKWIEDRREHFIAISHARDVRCTVEIACRRDGTILGLRGEQRVDMGAYVRTNGNGAPRLLGTILSGPYRVPNVDMKVFLELSNKTPSGTYRGPGRYEADFFRERLFDMAAGDLGIDRVEFRRRNLVSGPRCLIGSPIFRPRPRLPRSTAAPTRPFSTWRSKRPDGRRSRRCRAA
jgi:carbon-monoxide dehydrogenase large subunit